MLRHHIVVTAVTGSCFLYMIVSVITIFTIKVLERHVNLITLTVGWQIEVKHITTNREVIRGKRKRHAETFLIVVHHNSHLINVRIQCLNLQGEVHQGGTTLHANLDGIVVQTRNRLGTFS